MMSWMVCLSLPWNLVSSCECASVNLRPARSTIISERQVDRKSRSKLLDNAQVLVLIIGVLRVLQSRGKQEHELLQLLYLLLLRLILDV